MGPVLTEVRRLPEERRLRLTWSDGHVAEYGPAGSGASGNPFAPPPPPPAPEDATTLARASLSQIQSKVRATLVSGRALDTTTKAHLQETQARIAAALDPTVVRSIE
jgi:hypothetical protein